MKLDYFAIVCATVDLFSWCDWVVGHQIFLQHHTVWLHSNALIWILTTWGTFCCSPWKPGMLWINSLTTKKAITAHRSPHLWLETDQDRASSVLLERGNSLCSWVPRHWNGTSKSQKLKIDSQKTALISQLLHTSHWTLHLAVWSPRLSLLVTNDLDT